MKKFLPLFILLFSTTALFAQKQFKLSKIDKTSENNLSTHFKAYEIINLPINEINDFTKKAGNGIFNLMLDIPQCGVFDIELYAHDITTEDYLATLLTKEGRKTIEKDGNITYRGTLKNIENSKVFLTINNNTFFGTIFDGQKEYMIEPLSYLKRDNKNENAFVLYETSKVIVKEGNFCGVTDVQNAVNNNTAQQRTEAVVGCRQVELAIASDSYMYYRYGNDASKILSHNIGVINMVNSLFINSQFSTSIEFVVKGQNVSTISTEDQLIPNNLPNGTDAGDILGSFRVWGEAGNFLFNYDLAQFWTTRSMGFARGMAYFSGFCTPFKYSLTSDLEYADPTGSNAIVRNITAHEFGHSFNIIHDVYPYTGYYMMNSNLTLVATTFSTPSINNLESYFTNNALPCLTSCETSTPVADFMMSPAAICLGNSVQLTDKTLRNPTTWNWILANGTPAISTQRDPLVNYSTTDVKSIKLTATNGMGNNVSTKYLVVSQPPTVACNTAGFPFSPDGSGIRLFTLGSIHNLSENSTYDYNTYKDFSCTKNTVLLPNTKYYFNTVLGNYTNPNHLEIYIDYNNDGDFIDANEMVFTSGTYAYPSQAQESFTTITSPPVFNQMLRLRVVARDLNTAVTPCPTVLTYGQVEDYSVTFIQINPVPITLINFDIKKINSDVKLIWNTSQEIDFSHFIVEKSMNGIDFKPLARVNSNTSKNYELIVDEDIRPSTIYYRLKMMDDNGQFKYSKILYYYWEADTEIIKVQNPSTNGLIKIFANCKNPIFRLYDTKGSNIPLKLIQKNNENYIFENLNISEGIYFLKIETEGKIYSKKILF